MTKYTIKYTPQFKKDFKLAEKQGLPISELKAVVRLIANGDILPQKYRDHQLTGRWSGHRECHIRPDWLLIYYISENSLVLTLSRTGTHAKLFKK